MIMRRFPLFVVLMVLLSSATVFTSVAADKPVIHALLVIMDGDPNNFKQYEANERQVISLLRRVKNKTVCELETHHFTLQCQSRSRFAANTQNDFGLDSRSQPSA